MKYILIILFLFNTSFAQSFFSVVSGGGANLNPRSVANLRYWFSTDSGLVYNSGKVDKWYDRSGNGDSAFAPTSGLRPDTVQNRINTYTAVRFNGSTALEISGTVNTVTTIFVIGRLNTTMGASTFYSFLTLKPSSTTFTELLFTNDASYTDFAFRENFASVGNGSGNNVSSNNTNPFRLAWSNVAYSINGTAYTPVSTGLIARTTTDKASIGSRLSSANALASSARIDICEIIVYNAGLPGSDIIKIQNYLIRKYGF